MVSLDGVFMMTSDILIIGGGASGLMAAISAAQNSAGKKITVLEGNDRVGKKLLTTGNGRCNITNRVVTPDRFHSVSGGSAENIIDKFDVANTCDFFKKLGIIIKEGDDGKLYPASFQASSVLDALRFECERLGVDIICGERAGSIQKRQMTVTTQTGSVYSAKCIIVACGGKAAEKTGSDGSGYELLKSVGHKITKIFPVIVPVKTEKEKIRALKGIKVNATVRASCDGKSREEYGEVLFTDYGVSGPPVLQISRIISQGNSNGMVRLDLMPEYDEKMLFDLILDRSRSTFPDKLEFLLYGMINKRVGQAIIKESGFSLSDKASGLSANDCARISRTAKNFSLRTQGTLGLSSAQATGGGAALSEFDQNTLESQKMKGIFACGEVLDIDGDCGGFNLQWAWSSGYIAGKSAAISLHNN